MYWYFLIVTQIIIEMLPISSSGHLTLLESLLKKYAAFDIKKYFTDPETLKSIYYFLHGPTLFIVCGYFFKQWWNILFTSQGIAWHLLFYVIITDLITFLIYLWFKKTHFKIPLGFGFIITALALFSTAWCSGHKSVALLSFSDAIIMGFAQGLALLPGISRLAFTSSIGCGLGFSLYDAFLISWTVQTPLMAAAFIKSLNDLHQKGVLAQILNWRMCLAILISSGISVMIMSILLRMAENNTFYLFGWYMLVPLFIYMWVIIKGEIDVRDIQKGRN